MGVVNLRDAIILSMVKDGMKSQIEIESRLGLQRSMTRQSIAFLKKSGLISRTSIHGKEFFGLTAKGETTIERVFRRIGP